MNTFFKFYTALLGCLFASFISFDSLAQAERFNVDSIRAWVKQLSSDTEKVKTLIDVATNVIYCEDSTNKVIIANDAKKLAEKINWRSGIYDANRVLGQIYFNCLHNYPKAFQYFEENVAFAQKNKDTSNQAKADENIAKYYQKLSQYQQSLDYYNRALGVRPHPGIVIGIYGDMGFVYSLIGDYANALGSYNNAINILDSLSRAKVANDLQDTLLRAGLYLDIGDIYLAMQKPDRAYEYYDKSNDIGNSTNEIDFQIKSLTGIGKTYRMKNDYTRAIDNFGVALSKCSSPGSTGNHFREEVKILNELANTYLDTWTFTNALIFADSSRRLAEDQSFVELLPKSYTTLGNIYIKQNKYDLAIPYLQKALSISQKTHVLEDQREAWYALYSAYKDYKQPDNALNAFVNYIVMRDSINNIGKTNELIRKELEIGFKNQQLTDSIILSGKYDKKIERQRVFTYAGFAGLLLVLLLAFFIFRNYNIQRKYNELLSREKKSHLAHIEAQSNVLSDIAHIQAHQVRGPVATILGLVQLFNYDDPTDPVNKEVMEGLSSVTEKLDTVVKEVILKENRLRYGKD